MPVTEAKVGANKARSYNGDYMAIGKFAESVIIPWLRDTPQILGVEDLTNLRPMQEADVDCKDIFQLHDVSKYVANNE